MYAARNYYIQRGSSASLLTYRSRSEQDYDTASARLAAVQAAGAIFVGGGNTYRLLKALQQDAGLLELIASRVASGELLYIGSSAGSNLACPTIRNTNDMPIVWPESGLGGLHLVPFQINTHFIDEERELKNHMGEWQHALLSPCHISDVVQAHADRRSSCRVPQARRAPSASPSSMRRTTRQSSRCGRAAACSSRASLQSCSGRRGARRR